MKHAVEHIIRHASKQWIKHVSNITLAGFQILCAVEPELDSSGSAMQIE